MTDMTLAVRTALVALAATTGVLCFFLGLWASAIALVLVAWLLALWGERK